MGVSLSIMGASLLIFFVVTYLFTNAKVIAKLNGIKEKIDDIEKNNTLVGTGNTAQIFSSKVASHIYIYSGEVQELISNTSNSISYSRLSDYINLNSFVGYSLPKTIKFQDTQTNKIYLKTIDDIENPVLYLNADVVYGTKPIHYKIEAQDVDNPASITELYTFTSDQSTVDLTHESLNKIDTNKLILLSVGVEPNDSIAIKSVNLLIEFKVPL